MCCSTILREGRKHPRGDAIGGKQSRHDCDAFDKQPDSLYRDQASDMDAEVTVLETVLKMRDWRKPRF